MKAEERKQALAARRALTPEQRDINSLKIATYLMTLPEVAEANIILSYKASDDEVDLSGFHTWARMNGKKLAFPVCNIEGRMEAFIPDSSADFEEGQYGIMAPIVERSRLIPPEEIDLVVAPLVAFDEKLNRCGHGKGYYDRYLHACTSSYKVGVAFEVQKLPSVTMEEFDIPLNMIISESNIY